MLPSDLIGTLKFPIIDTISISEIIKGRRKFYLREVSISNSLIARNAAYNEFFVRSSLCIQRKDEVPEKH
jgi:hypothetical protein